MYLWLAASARPLVISPRLRAFAYENRYAAPSPRYSSFLDCAEGTPILMEANDLVAARLRQWEQEDALRNINKLERVTNPNDGGAEKVNGE